jgi:hypothetical protein
MSAYYIHDVHNPWSRPVYIAFWIVALANFIWMILIVRRWTQVKDHSRSQFDAGQVVHLIRHANLMAHSCLILLSSIASRTESRLGIARKSGQLTIPHGWVFAKANASVTP